MDKQQSREDALIIMDKNMISMEKRINELKTKIASGRPQSDVEALTHELQSLESFLEAYRINAKLFELNIPLHDHEENTKENVKVTEFVKYMNDLINMTFPFTWLLK